MNPQSLDGYAETPVPTDVPPDAPAKAPPAAPAAALASLLSRLRAVPKRIVWAAVAAGVLFLTASGALAYWQFAAPATPWFVDTPLYTSRIAVSGDRIRKTLSTLLYAKDGKYSATNTVYEHDKPPAEERYAGTWRQDKEWVCLRMNWMPDKEFCNAFVKTDQGWLLVSRSNAQTTPLSLTPLPPPVAAELAPPAPPPPPADCTFGGKPLAHAASVPAFEASIVPSGQPCKAEVRTCTNGQLSGTFQNARCSAAIALPQPHKPTGSAPAKSSPTAPAKPAR